MHAQFLVSLGLALAAILTSPAAASDFSCSWTTGTNGTWNVAGNWSTCNSTFPNNSAVPTTTTYDATIAAGGTYTVTLNSAVLLNNLTINAAGATLAQTANTLTIASGGIVNILAGTYRFVGGTLEGGTVQEATGTSLAFANATNTLDGVTVKGTVNVADVGGGTGGLEVGPNGLIVLTQAGASPGVVNVGTTTASTSSRLGFLGTQTFDNATVNLGSASSRGQPGHRGHHHADAGRRARWCRAPAPSVRRASSAVPDNLINQGLINANLNGLDADHQSEWHLHQQRHGRGQQRRHPDHQPGRNLE